MCAGSLVVALCGVFVLRLADWQLLNGASFLQQADESTNITVTMPTNRGEIVDRNGVGLATNKTGYALEFARAYTDMDTLNATILRLTEIVEAQGEQWLDTLPIQLDAAGNYVFVEGRDDDIAYLKSEDFLKVNTYTDAATCMENLIDRYFETDGRKRRRIGAIYKGTAAQDRFRALRDDPCGLRLPGQAPSTHLPRTSARIPSRLSARTATPSPA